MDPLAQEILTELIAAALESEQLRMEAEALKARPRLAEMPEQSFQEGLFLLKTAGRLTNVTGTPKIVAFTLNHRWLVRHLLEKDPGFSAIIRAVVDELLKGSSMHSDTLARAVRQKEFLVRCAVLSLRDEGRVTIGIANNEEKVVGPIKGKPAELRTWLKTH